ncbi:hypothetical protein SAMN04488012_102357 [Palleronia salina]|uniref:Uncharacterized protein n=1 Tax=Palleronia salina TaxID=313368 RepID=A0A1M6DEC2_9RHOB|nr:hypothetical protein SAMN04488012_102357 [Palleronia salina]
MAAKGPGVGELYVRLAISVAGLALLIGALLVRGVPSGPAFFEVIIVAGGFFGLSALWSLRGILRARSAARGPRDEA